MMKNDNSMVNNHKKRIFIAINLDSHIKNKLSEVQKNFIAEGFKIKWVYPNLLHITLEFLGDQSPKQIESICLLLKKITKQQKDFSISLSPNLGVFPSLDKPRIIWAGIEKGSMELKKLSQSIKSSLLKNNLLNDNKEFLSHITIGRIKYFTGRNMLTDNMNLVHLKKQSQKIISIELMESKLTPTGPIYSILYSFPFVHY